MRRYSLSIVPARGDATSSSTTDLAPAYTTRARISRPAVQLPYSAFMLTVSPTSMGARAAAT